MRIVIFMILCVSVSGCTPVVLDAGRVTGQPQLLNRAFITEDGTYLPFSHWPSSTIDAVLIAVHGFNDYRNFFQQPGDYFTRHNIISYAYDQRGFGGSAMRGYWAGVETYVDDLQTFVQLIKQRHPDRPVYLLGESMGGAIIIHTMTQNPSLPVAGIILAAPAVWGRKTMPWYQTMLLWTLSHSLPWMTLTGEGLDIKASDNIEMLKALSRDPLIIKETRVDTIYGLVNLMDQALDDASLITGKTLLLYGEKDEIVPMQPTLSFLQDLLKAHPADRTVAIYQEGFHMLLRDLSAPQVWGDILSWISSGDKLLPSGADLYAQTVVDESLSSHQTAAIALPTTYDKSE